MKDINHNYMSKQGNESAFPWVDRFPDGTLNDLQIGLTKREIFAMNMMSARIAIGHRGNCAKLAVLDADSLLSALAESEVSNG